MHAETVTASVHRAFVVLVVAEQFVRVGPAQQSAASNVSSE
jgi:hypothetical protein